MKIDEMRVAIRPMTTHEAVDLGFMMAREWFFPLWKIWLGMALPVFLVIYLGIMTVAIWLELESVELIKNLAGLLFWFCKPLYEKPMVHWLGNALFNQRLSVSSSIKQGWKTTGLYAGTLLFKKRISFHRQLILPILLLEKPDSTQFSKRLQLLRRGQSGSITWFTIIMLHIEVVMGIGVLLFLSQMVPKSFVSSDTLLDILKALPLWMEYIWAGIYFLCVSVVAPFFICGGFAIYLTKRCLLEGWDIELIFKQLNQRYKTTEASPLQKLQYNDLQNQQGQEVKK